MTYKSGPGGHPDPIVEAWALRFGIPVVQMRKNMPTKICWQLAQCKDDEARRLVLGVSQCT